jgi:hypothetical protein
LRNSPRWARVSSEVSVCADRSGICCAGLAPCSLSRIEDWLIGYLDWRPAVGVLVVRCGVFNFGKPKTAGDWIVHVAGAIVALFLVWWMLRVYVL